jgi:hypothetical protein
MSYSRAIWELCRVALRWGCYKLGWHRLGNWILPPYKLNPVPVAPIEPGSG